MKRIFCVFILFNDNSTSFSMLENNEVPELLKKHNAHPAYLDMVNIHKHSPILTQNGTTIHIKELSEESRKDMLTTLHYAEESQYSNAGFISIRANSPLLSDEFVKDLPVMCTPEYQDMNDTLSEDLYNIDGEGLPIEFTEKHKEVIDRISHACKMNDVGYFRIEYVTIPEAKG